MSNTPAPTTATPCAPPAIDSFELRIAPVGNALAFCAVTVWALVNAWFLADRYDWDASGQITEAVVTDTNSIRYQDAQGQAQESYPPSRKGWRPQPGERLSIRYRPDTREVEFSDQHPTQLRLAWIFVLMSLPMYAGVYWAHRLVRGHRQRLARLREFNLRLRPTQWRIVQERRRGKNGRMEHRIVAEFAHGGQHYAAVSDLYVGDPTPDLDPDAMRVWLDPTDPRQSLIALDSVPSRNDQHRAELDRTLQKYREAQARR